MAEPITREEYNESIGRVHEKVELIKNSVIRSEENAKHIDETVKNFIIKVDRSVFDTEEGFIIKTKSKLTGICVQLKNQWYLITLLLVGIFGIAWGVIRKK